MTAMSVYRVPQNCYFLLLRPQSSLIGTVFYSRNDVRNERDEHDKADTNHYGRQ
jgi:hypothetical protein